MSIEFDLPEGSAGLGVNGRGVADDDAPDQRRSARAFRLGELVLDGARFELRRGEERLPVQPKVLQLLFYLVEHRERPVSEEELLRVLWPDERVTEASVKRAIHGARKALGDDGDAQSSIHTVRGRGYQLVLPVSPHEPERGTPDEAAKSEGTIEAPRSGGLPLSQDTFVGRRSALAMLEASMRDAFSGYCRLLLLIGDAGIGKTRMLTELGRRAALMRADVWVGRCIEDEGAPAFWPWTQILRDGKRDRGARALIALMGKSVADIAEGIPELREWLPNLPMAPPIAEQSARFRFFDGMVAFLRRAADQRPIALLFDDLQRADQPTLRLLSFVARNLDTSRVLIACTMRPIASQPIAVREAMTSFMQPVSATCVELQGFSRQDVDDFLELRVGQRGPESFVTRLHRLTGGSPLFLQQIAHGWQTSGRLDAAIDWEQLLSKTQGQGLDGSIAHRLSVLPRSALEVLQVATVLGSEFTVARLSRLLAIDASTILAELSAAKDAGLVQQLPDAIGTFGFTHMLIRDALYEQLGIDARAALHAKAGEVLEAEDPSADVNVAELAHHFAQAWPAHDAGKALHYALRAAAAATRRLAYEEAVGHLDRALHVQANGGGNLEQRMRLLLGKGEALSHAAEVARARATLFEAVGLARQLHAIEVIAHAAKLMAVLPESGNVDWEQIGLLREALGAMAEDDPERPYLLSLLAKCSTYSTDSAAREALALTALERSPQITCLRLRAETLQHCHRALPEPKHLGQREAIGEELVRLGHRSGDHMTLWHAATAQVQNCLERGDFLGVDRAVALIEGLATQMREPMFRWYLAVFRAMRQYVAGHIAEAQELALRALNMGACVGEATARHVYCMQVTGWHRVLGSTSECEVLVREMMLRYPALSGWRLMHVGLEADRGHNDPARRFLAQLHEDPSLMHEPFTMALLCFLAELGSYVGTPAMTRWLYDLMLPYATLWGNCGFGNTYGPIGRQLGALAIRIGDLDAAEGHLESALASSEAAKSPTFISLTCIVYARTLLKRETPASRRRALDMLIRSEALNRPNAWNGNSSHVRHIASRAGLFLPDLGNAKIE